MHQAGIVAAAVYAVRHHRQRLADDHANARLLAEGLAGIAGVELMGAPVTTNIVRFRTPGRDAGGIARELERNGVRLFATGHDSFRAVTSLMVNAKDISTSIQVVSAIVATTPG